MTPNRFEDVIITRFHAIIFRWFIFYFFFLSRHAFRSTHCKQHIIIITTSCLKRRQNSVPVPARDNTPKQRNRTNPRWNYPRSDGFKGFRGIPKCITRISETCQTASRRGLRFRPLRRHNVRRGVAARTHVRAAALMPRARESRRGVTVWRRERRTSPSRATPPPPSRPDDVRDHEPR